MPSAAATKVIAQGDCRDQSDTRFDPSVCPLHLAGDSDVIHDRRLDGSRRGKLHPQLVPVRAFVGAGPDWALKARFQ